jgi:four helix bundle protein
MGQRVLGWHGANQGDADEMERRNLNSGFKKLRVWQDALSLYVMAYDLFSNSPFELKKVASNCIDAAHSVSRNIAEGYCRRSLKEYLNPLNIEEAGTCSPRVCSLLTEELHRISTKMSVLENSLRK